MRAGSASPTLRALENAGHVTGHAGHVTGERRQRVVVRSHARRTYTHGGASTGELWAAGHMWRVTGAGRGAGKTRGSRAGGRSSEVT